MHIALGPHQQPQGGGHIAQAHQSSGHLVEQRLEKVEVAFIDQGDAHIGALETLAGLNAGETAAHYHHMGFIAQFLHGRFQFQKEPLGREGHRGAAEKLDYKLCRFLLRARERAQTLALKPSSSSP